MKEELHTILNQYAPILINDIDLLISKWTVKELKRQENFITFRQRNNSVGFLRKGLLRSYYHDDKGNEQTTAFIEENSFFQN
ncbi:hypothetical protein [Tenacibaculum sp. MAR_2009_124]|uniref:hypothetical protein n=1 Tax=Tenacibaculum sp. MAR_2009_124 TaxID=1250059 RepID=UPI000B82DAB2|nr:hypothetical protein [Tenacibaculum sp. MAR_2009_124]